MITVTAFKDVPDFAKGLVRDLRVRWALEEAGIPYEVRLIGPEDQGSPAYRACQPFGQVPVLEEGDLTLFESGAIVLHIAERSETLLPADPAARARARAWLMCALNTIEVALFPVVEIDLFFPQEEWARQRRPGAEAALAVRLAELSTWLGDKDYLDGRFTCGDLMMATVLRLLRHTDMVAAHSNVAAYLKRCESRPAFQRALGAQMADFAKAA